MALKKSSNKTIISKSDPKVEQVKIVDVLAEYNAEFVPFWPNSKRINVFAQEDGFTASKAKLYDGNLGLATGRIVALDIDKNYNKINKLLGDYSDTLEVTRDNASSRGCLIFELDIEVPSKTLLPKGKSHPVMELKGVIKDGHADRKLIAGTYKKGVYVNNGKLPLSITLKELNEHILIPIYEYYEEEFVPAIDARFAINDFQYYNSGDRRYDLIREHCTCFDVVDALNFGYTHHSGDWYQVDHPDHDTIHFNEYAFKHHSANISGGMLDFYIYLEGVQNFNKGEVTDVWTSAKRSKVVSGLLKSKGVSTTDVAKRQLMDKMTVENIESYLNDLYTDSNKWENELKVISQTLGVHMNVLYSMDIEQLAHHKLATDRRLAAQIRRSSMFIELSNSDLVTPFLNIDLDNEESYKEKFVVNDLIAEKDNILFIGDSSVGKTFLMLHLGVGLATGTSLFGGDIQSDYEKTVIYCTGEGTGRLSRRLAGVSNKFGLKKLPDNFKIYNGQVNLFTGEGLEQLEVHLLENEISPDLIIFDNFRSMSGGADENSAAAVSAVQMSMTVLSELFNTATLLIHHTNKSDVYSGSSAFRSRTDVMLIAEQIMVDESVYGTNMLTTIRSDKQRDGKPLTPLYYHIADNEKGPYVREIKYGAITPAQELIQSDCPVKKQLGINSHVGMTVEIIAEFAEIDIEEVEEKLKKLSDIIDYNEEKKTYRVSKEYLQSKQVEL